MTIICTVLIVVTLILLITGDFKRENLKSFDNKLNKIYRSVYHIDR